MLPLGMILGFAGYGVGTWGYILVKGWNISLRQWFSPVHPYTGDLAKAGTVPAGQIFPGGKGQAQPQAGANTGTQTPRSKKTSTTGQGSQQPTQSRF